LISPPPIKPRHTAIDLYKGDGSELGAVMIYFAGSQKNQTFIFAFTASSEWLQNISSSALLMLS
jgi:hypothetical protein